jgi:hypothetical protein
LKMCVDYKALNKVTMKNWYQEVMLGPYVG